MRVLLTGGGTAGHINPAIAIADIIKRNAPASAIAFVGTPKGMENKLVREAGYPLYHVNIKGISRKLSPANLHALWLAAVSPIRAKKILREFHPDIVIGTGGYVSWPILRAAALQGIKTVLHESNSSPGLAFLKLAPHMDGLWLNFKETEDLLPRGCVTPVHTGNPLRRRFASASKEVARRELGLSDEDVFLLSFGGSLGAEALNEAMLRVMQKIDEIPHLYCVHACGERYFSQMRAHFQDTTRAKLASYIQNMATYMSAADILVCRAGAMTISEAALCGKCVIFIPSPNVTANHQYKNAAILADAGAAMLVEEGDLPSDKLLFLIKSLVADKETREHYEKKIKSFAKMDTEHIIWREIQNLTQKTKAEIQKREK